MDPRMFGTSQAEDLENVNRQLAAFSQAAELIEKMKALGKNYPVGSRHNNQAQANTLRDYDPVKGISPICHWEEMLKVYSQFKCPGTLSRGIDRLWATYFKVDPLFIDSLTSPTPIKARLAFYNILLDSRRALLTMRAEMKRLTPSISQLVPEKPSV